MMKRYLKAESDLYLKFQTIVFPYFHQRAFSHTAQVVALTCLLYDLEPENLELMKLAALFHDTGTFLENASAAKHAKVSAEIARNYLSNHDFSEDEIDLIVQVISNHSDKDRIDDPYSELLKNADALASYLEDFDQNYYQKHKERLDSILKRTR